ncbi:SpoIID/LytB domain-containing protein [Kineosporia babensis]|uniref:SpoIID/LytB domain-containing protein n=1 Tax=Kineosporia babensis TaxID=499548 RepID=A0A9X1SWU6_9ACTN|nr:SpoIID/LytB domain-containing protein [Kineosporia babensis]MCD5315462.1 SpoIID/LytB domain-containing protein [Kineosporia babensis]
MRRPHSITLTVLGTAVAVLAGSGAAAAAPLPVAAPKKNCPSASGGNIGKASVPKGAVKIYGHGWGHGMGMSQYGAQGAARLGCGYKTILKTYYHDVSLTKQNLNAPVVLNLGSGASKSKLQARTGSVRWSSSVRNVVQPKGTTWTVSRKTINSRPGIALFDDAGKRRMFVQNSGLMSAAHTGKVVNVYPYGGSTKLSTRYDTARFVGSKDGITVKEVITASDGQSAVQKYLMGLAEVPISWPIEALKAQTVAARTYLASKYSESSEAYVLSTTTYDQVYKGWDVESVDLAGTGRWRKAVTATNEQVLVDGSGRRIEALYSSSMGGYTENREYVWGNYEISYLKPVDDSRWDAASDNPFRNWSVGMSKKVFAKKFGFDSVSSYKVAARGKSSRQNGVTITGKIDGKKQTKTFTGAQARYRLGLKSPGFTFG